MFDITGALFFALALFLFWGAAVRPEQRERRLYLGIGAVMVGAGNIVIPRNMPIGFGMLALGVYVVVASSRSRG